MTVTVAEDEEEADVSPKALDVHEDEGLLYYLKNGKHEAGQPKKQIKRVEKLAEKYSFVNNKILVKTKDGDRVVPGFFERDDIIEKAHLLGHFQAETTAKRVKTSYWWRGLEKDVERVIGKCVNCKENHRTVPLEHPALATVIREVGERVGIDLAFGLPVSTNGYTGICVITEYFTKFVYAKPIKNKTDEDVLAVFKECVMLYGPPKIVLSDQGLEFNNKLMTAFVNMVGIEHKVTSAYHPRTNGQTEKSNYTLIEALRRSIGTDAINWPYYLGWIIMAYNSRVHSTTNFSPYELLTGRKMNNFEDFSSIELDWSVAAGLEKRSREIKVLVEQTHVKAKANIEKSQENQKRSQNRQHRITTEQLPVGTTVYVTVTGMHDKLHPRYRGPFKVTGQTNLGNYLLQNALGEPMMDNFPLSRLKVVTDDESVFSDYVRVEKILDHRKSKGREFEYFVKWKDLPESENSWEPPEHFLDKDLISNYWKKITLSTPEKGKRGRGRPRKNQMVSNILTLTLLALFLMAVSGSKQTITNKPNFNNISYPYEMRQDMYVCSLKHTYNLVNLDDSCDEEVEL